MRFNASLVTVPHSPRTLIPLLTTALLLTGWASDFAAPQQPKSPSVKSPTFTTLPLAIHQRFELLFRRGPELSDSTISDV